MWIAELETRHFDFMACGKTKSQVGYVLARTWEKHCDQYNISPYGPLFENPEHLRSGAAIYELRIGDGIRDRSRILENGHTKTTRDPGYRRTGGAI